MNNAVILLAVFCAQQFAKGTPFVQHRGLYSRDVSQFEVTVPQKISPGGHHLDWNVSHHHHHLPGRRVKRDSHSLPETLHYRLMVGGKAEVLDLEPSTGFLSPGLRVWRGRRADRVARHKTACHYRGVARHHARSSVALSACDGLAGVMRLDSGEYWIEPSTGANTTLGRPHIVFRRGTATRHRKRKKKRKKKKHEKNCGTREPPRLPASKWSLEWSSLAGLSGGKVQGRGRRRGKQRPPRSVSTENHVETLLVADASMVEFHHDGDVETYLLTIMNMVSALYEEPSIGNSINVVVVRIVLIEDDAVEGLNITINADNALNSFCNWQEAQNPTSESDPYHHDVAVLVTRKDICARQHTPCSTLGVAHVGGMCQPTRSCNINEDNGITLAHTIAHEMGHNFGMFHDSAKSGCVSRSGPTLHVMTPTFEADSLNIAWSDCSRRDITHFLDEGLGSCLEDRPEQPQDYRYPELPAGAMYNADHQCRLQFGPESAVCTPTDEICSRLWCLVDGMCTTNLYPAAPGTHCDKHMWCLNQTCVAIGDLAEPIAGGWGDWGPWSPCSRTCGAGVSIKERLCDHPSPANGGQYCLGERKRYKICNIQPCPESPQSFRAEQCSAYNNEPYFGKNYTWLPYFESSEPCELYCTDAEDTIIASLGDSALDGTPCNLGARDMCISGICRKVGCDWVVDSEAVEDKCGVCHGDGKLCSTQRGYYNVTQGDGYTEVAVIPSGARNIRVEELSSSRNYIGIGSAVGSPFYLNGDGEITIAGEYTVAGSAALYERHKELEKIRIPGPIKEDILIYVIFRDTNPGLYFEFTLPNESPALTAEYQWVMSDWSTCSATCGGGEQVSRAVCKEVFRDVTAAGKCDGELKPSDRMKVCNLQSCPVRWWIGPWQLCPVTCGELALRKRTVLCVSGTKELALPDSDCAGQPRPHDHEPCSDIPPCLLPSLLASFNNTNHSSRPDEESSINLVTPVETRNRPPKKQSEILQLRQSSKTKYDQEKWTIRPWSQCSVSCGIGFTKRTTFCASKKCNPKNRPISVKQCFRQC